MDPPIQHGEVDVEHEGVTHRGTWELDGCMLTVSLGEASKATQLGGERVDDLARLLLRELVVEKLERHKRIETATERILTTHAATFEKLAKN